MNILTKKETRDFANDKDFAKLFDYIIIAEGGYSNHKEDNGGATNFGITEYTLRNLKINIEPKDLTKKIASEIYYKHYYKRYKIDLITNFDIKEIAMSVLINMSPISYGSILQKAYNLLAEGSPLVEDGLVGKNTLSKINSYPNKKRLLNFIVIETCVHYNRLAKANETQEKFLAGWYNRMLKFTK